MNTPAKAGAVDLSHPQVQGEFKALGMTLKPLPGNIFSFVTPIEASQYYHTTGNRVLTLTPLQETNTELGMQMSFNPGIKTLQMTIPGIVHRVAGKLVILLPELQLFRMTGSTINDLVTGSIQINSVPRDWDGFNSPKELKGLDAQTIPDPQSLTMSVEMRTSCRHFRLSAARQRYWNLVSPKTKFVPSLPRLNISEITIGR